MKHKPNAFKRYATTHDVANRLDISKRSVRYHWKVGNFPVPKITLSLIRFVGKSKIQITMNLWSPKQMRIIRKKMRSILPRGNYKKNRL